MYKIGNYKITAKKITAFILFFSIIMETLIAEFHFPETIRYICDICMILIFVVVRLKPFVYFYKTYKYIFYSICFLLFVCIVSAICNAVPLQLFVWGFRNTFRGIMYLLLLVYCFSYDDILKIFAKLYIIQFLNLILALYQFFILHHEMDGVGGIFGYGNGAGVNIFNALLVSYYINMYLENRCSVRKVLFSILSSLIIAAIAEEKITFIFIAIILVVSIIINKFSLKKIVIAVTGGTGLFVGLNVLKYYYPLMYEKLVNISDAISYLKTTYEVGYRLPRIGSFSIIDNMFFGESIFHSLFGIGFGNAETSNFSFLQSDFYNRYGDLNYRWFIHQWTYIETGIIGFISYLMIFCIILFSLFHLLKYHKDTIVNPLIITSISTTFCCVISIWYNAMLKSDMSYLAFFSIAIGLIGAKIIYEGEV